MKPLVLSSPFPASSAARLLGLSLLLLVLVGCGSQARRPAPEATPAQVRGTLLRLLPDSLADRQGWAADIQAAFAAQKLAPTRENLCSVLAVAEQESNFQADPQVPGLGRIARGEMQRRAERLHVPGFVLDAALALKSPGGKSYSQRLDAVHSERELSAIFDDFIGMVPLGEQLFGRFNPVHTGGPMQVSVAFAEAHAQGYPYPILGSIRHEVFSRRGGLYFGIAHLLGYPVAYDKPLYRFADYNAGWYASRNAAFQRALSLASGKPLALDGDLIRYDSGGAGATELAVRSLGKRLDMSDSDIRRALEQGEQPGFGDTRLYSRVFALAEKAEGRPLARAILPGITLKSPKITRQLTTAWFSQRVDERYQRCLERAGKG
ncbi:DUF1615 domain-containing protein [Pseudomonas panipatensis]|uniref:Lipoprotein n=1 Tax=Pseudomonas panipatensis TaxID=428992 RepID=A0A1G8KNB8_9PSED|nr:DUF1615 domain-containing protein [Pseudomonas panipatensis]SDI44934.1 Protein of unknown function [Pseudomonas panipatensis]SMP70177.1 Protein of unknown function [Pseudomonas panipatensis]